MLTISGTSLCSQDTLNPCTPQYSAAQYCLEELKLLFWWFKDKFLVGQAWRILTGKNFLPPPSPLALLTVFFTPIQCYCKACLLLQACGSDVSSTSSHSSRHRQNHIKTDTTANGFHSNALKLHFLFPQWSFSKMSAANKLLFSPFNHSFSCPLNDHCLLFLSLLSHTFYLLCSLFLLVHFHMSEYTILHCNTSYPPFSDGVLLLLLSFSLAATIGMKWKAFYLIRNALNISLLVQHFSLQSPMLEGEHPGNWWLMPYICVYVLYSGNYGIERALLCISWHMQIDASEYEILLHGKMCRVQRLQNGWNYTPKQLKINFPQQVHYPSIFWIKQCRVIHLSVFQLVTELLFIICVWHNFLLCNILFIQWFSK